MEDYYNYDEQLADYYDDIEDQQFRKSLLAKYDYADAGLGSLIMGALKKGGDSISNLGSIGEQAQKMYDKLKKDPTITRIMNSEHGKNLKNIAILGASGNLKRGETSQLLSKEMSKVGAKELENNLGTNQEELKNFKQKLEKEKSL